MDFADGSVLAGPLPMECPPVMSPKSCGDFKGIKAHETKRSRLSGKWQHRSTFTLMNCSDSLNLLSWMLTFHNLMGTGLQRCEGAWSPPNGPLGGGHSSALKNPHLEAKGLEFSPGGKIQLY